MMSRDLRLPLLESRRSQNTDRGSPFASSRNSTARSYWRTITDNKVMRHHTSKPHAAKRPPRFARAWLLDVLEGKPRTAGALSYQRLLVLISSVTVMNFVLRSFSGISEVWHVPLIWGDRAATVLTLMDYFLRILAAPAMRGFKSPLLRFRQLRYMLSLHGLQDALASLPGLLILTKEQHHLPEMWVRIIRLLTLLRTRRQAHVMNTVTRVLYANRRILSVSACMCLFMLLWTSATLWVLASASPDHAETFPSMGSSLYMAVLMLTGVGMPEGELTWPMRIMVAVTAIASVAFFAIPAAMLTWGFEGEAERLARRELRQERLRRLERHRGKDDVTMTGVAKNLSVQKLSLRDHHAEHFPSSSSDSDSLAEYLQGLGGGEDPEELMEQALSFFEACDPHGTSPLLPRAKARAEELQHATQVETLRQDLRETAYTMLRKLPGRLERAGHQGALAMTTDLHEEVRLRRFALTARSFLRGDEPPELATSLEMVEQTAGASGTGQSSSLESQAQLLRALAAEVAQLRQLVDERLPQGTSRP